MNVDMTMFQQAFFEEATELLAELETCLLRLEENPTDHELLNTIFRCAHSMKGGSATFGFPEIAQFTHGLETLLDKLREGQLQVTAELCELLFKCNDQLRLLLDSAMGAKIKVPDGAPLTEKITSICASANGMMQQPKECQAAPEPLDEGFGVWDLPKQYYLRFVPGPDVFKSGADPLLILRNLREIADIRSIICDASDLPSIEELDPETCYLKWEIDLTTDLSRDEILDLFDFAADESEIILREVGDVKPESATAVVPSASAAVSDVASGASAGTSKPDVASLRVSADKIDGLVNLVGELVICQSMLAEATRDFTMDKLPKLLETVTSMERASREMQERVMGIRLLPVKQAFARFPRLIRDLSAVCHKKIELKTVGEETELDKTLIEALGDPLTHLIRNSIDHGLETPEERKAAGKSETGTIWLRSFYDGGGVVIEIEDDGRGLNREKLLSKAIDKGLVSSDDSLSDEQVYNLIFHPGFSTAAKVTDLSGRGVGMDIVKQAVSAIGGTIKVKAEPGKGVSTSMRLPLTMAILEGQSMSIGDTVYILPLTSIIESLRPKEEDLHDIAQLGEVVSVRGEYLKVLRLHEVFSIEPKIVNPWEGSLVLVESDGKKVALLADELIGQGQIVIKSLEANYRKVDGIMGATILGDGQVALIVDVPGLVRDMGGQGGPLKSAA